MFSLLPTLPKCMDVREKSCGRMLRPCNYSDRPPGPTGQTKRRGGFSYPSHIPHSGFPQGAMIAMVPCQESIPADGFDYSTAVIEGASWCRCGFRRWIPREGNSIKRYEIRPFRVPSSESRTCLYLYIRQYIINHSTLFISLEDTTFGHLKCGKATSKDSTGIYTEFIFLGFNITYGSMAVNY